MHLNISLVIITFHNSVMFTVARPGGELGEGLAYLQSHPFDLHKIN